MSARALTSSSFFACRSEIVTCASFSALSDSTSFDFHLKPTTLPSSKPALTRIELNCTGKTISRTARTKIAPSRSKDTRSLPSDTDAVNGDCAGFGSLAIVPPVIYRGDGEWSRLSQRLPQLLKQREARGPVAQTALTVDVPGVADGHKAASPRLGKPPRSLCGDVGIVRAGDDHARKREPAQWHGSKSGRAGGVRRGLGIARRDEQSATHPPPGSGGGRPMSHESAQEELWATRTASGAARIASSVRHQSAHLGRSFPIILLPITRCISGWADSISSANVQV